jgi:MYXO-CTERM domain-containing protein
MRGTIIFLLSMLLATPAAAQSAFLDSERARLRAHFDDVLAELEAADTSALSAEQRARRAEHLVRLAEYRDRGVFPQRYSGPAGRVPEFRDVHGTRCAMGELIYLSGETQLVDDVARTANSATIAELSADPRLTRWLTENGLTVEEAGRVQPSYNTAPAGCFCSANSESVWSAVATEAATQPTNVEPFHVVEVELLELLGGTDARTQSELATVRVRFAAPQGQSLLVGFSGSDGMAFPTDDGDATVACSTESSAIGEYANWTTCRADSKVGLDVAVAAMLLPRDDCYAAFSAEDASLARCGDGACSIGIPGSDPRPWLAVLGAVAVVLRRRRR